MSITKNDSNVLVKYDDFFGEIAVEEVQIMDNLQMHASMDTEMLAMKQVVEAV